MRERNRARIQAFDRAYAENEAQLRGKRAELKQLAGPSAAADKEAASSKPSPAIDKLRADIKELDAALKAIAQEKEKFKTDVRFAPRVILLIPARVPELPNRYDLP